MKLVRVRLGQGRSIGLCGIPACAESAILTDLACNGHHRGSREETRNALSQSRGREVLVTCRIVRTAMSIICC